MWLAPGIELPRNCGAGFGLAGHHGRFGRVDVEVAGAGVVDVLRENRLEHLVQLLDVRILDVARAAARLEQEQRVGVERRDVEIVRIRARDLAHRVRVGAVLLDPLVGVEALDVAHRHRLDERALLRVAPWP